ncbi:hypothetical protein KFE17_11955 [Faecalicatena sp. Marseille-Q4148]|nr:hypothetical protein KFE17_11955 [Faecalicatena sp. Marseille-Q4148]
MKKGIAKIGDEIIAVVETDEVKVIMREVNGMREIKVEEKQKKEIQLIDIRPRARPAKRKSA